MFEGCSCSRNFPATFLYQASSIPLSKGQMVSFRIRKLAKKLLSLTRRANVWSCQWNHRDLGKTSSFGRKITCLPQIKEYLIYIRLCMNKYARIISWILGSFKATTTSHPQPAAKSEDLPGQKPSTVGNMRVFEWKLWDCLTMMFLWFDDFPAEWLGTLRNLGLHGRFFAQKR